jgi:hypothetical protein
MWEIREQAVQFQETLQLLHTRIMHISRSLNVLAHNCAREAKTLSRVSLLCSCSNSTHRSSSCPVSVAINRLLPSGTIFVSVQCLWVMELGCSPPYLCSKKKTAALWGPPPAEATTCRSSTSSTMSRSCRRSALWLQRACGCAPPPHPTREAQHRVLWHRMIPKSK